MPLFRALLVLGGVVLLNPEAAHAQTERSARKPPSSARPTTPSAWRNHATAAPAAPVLSRQDKLAYDNCPDPSRYARKQKARKRMVLIR